MEKFLLLISIILSTLLVVLGNENSFSSLNSSYIMEAKKRFMAFDITKLVYPPMPSYSFSIYSRGLFEKSMFKDYDSLFENRLARSQARAEYLGSILENAYANGTHASKREKELMTTSVEFANGDYIAAFILGTEDQPVIRHLLIDTGSDLVWWQCGPCSPNKCYEQRNEPLYYFTQSRTYRRIDCRAEPRNCILKPNVFECTSFENTCEYEYKYVDGSKSRGWVAEDVITFALDHSQARILFGCGKDQTSGTAFSRLYSGIAGLARRDRAGAYSLPSQFEADIMALCLPKFYSTTSTTLSFHSTPFRKGTTARLYPSPSDHLYLVNIHKLFVNHREMLLAPTDRANCIVDTGSVISRFPRAIYIALRDAFRSEVRNHHLSDHPFQGFDTCYTVDPGVPPDFPILMMYFSNYNLQNMLVLQQERVVLHERGQYCFAFMPWDQPTALIGSFQLQAVGLTFNTAANILSFSLDAC